MANKVRLGFVGANVNLELGLSVALSGATGQSRCRANGSFAPLVPRARKRLAKPSERSSPSMISGQW